MPEPLFSEGAKKILVYLQNHIGAEADNAMIAEAVDMPTRTTSCTITSALIRKGYATREEVDGRKVVRLTPNGRSVNPYAVC
jgi:DNA-binding MarR family transcriptional regulator